MCTFQLEMCEICEFQLEMCAIDFEMHKTTDFRSDLLVFWELVTKGYQGRPMKCMHFTLLKLKFTRFERLSPGIVIL